MIDVPSKGAHISNKQTDSTLIITGNKIRKNIH